MKPFATEIGILSHDVKLFMISPLSNLHYVLNYTTTSLLMKGQVDESAVTVGVDDPIFSDAEGSNLIEQDT